MQRSRHAVRYYIDHNHTDDGAEVRSVPVTIHAAEGSDPTLRASTEKTEAPTLNHSAKSSNVSAKVRAAARRAARRGRA